MKEGQGMVSESVYLSDGIVTCKQTDNAIDYIMELRKQYKYDSLSDDEAFFAIPSYSKTMWKVYIKDKLAGVIWLSYIPAFGWVMDAYRDDKLVKTLDRLDYSYRIGKLVMDYFFENLGDELTTAHDKRSRAATMVCKRLGFKDIGYMETKFGTMIILKKII